MADTTKMTALQNLSAQLPIANKRVAAGANAARTMQVQNAVAAAPTTAQVQPTAQQTGAATAQNAGQQMIQTAKQGLEQQAQVGQLGLAEQGQQNQAALASAAQGAKAEQMNQAEQFANLNQDMKKKMYDETMKFQTDELGRTKFNEMQLADYYRSKAVSQEQFKNYSQKATQASKRNLEMMNKAHELVVEDLNNKYNEAKAKGDFETMKAIQQSKFDADQAMQREVNRDKNNAAVWTAGGMVAGGTAGAILGGPQGAQAGASGGGALGGAIAGLSR